MENKNLNNVEKLLESISIIQQKNNSILDATGGRFNLFGILGVNHYENTHSAILAELLNPKGSHGLKDKFLVQFLKRVVLKENSEFEFETSTANVTTEYSMNEGRIDILIESRGKAIIIENKIYANDQFEQLQRYQRFAKNKYNTKNYLIIYLTLDGKDASDHSSEGVNYIPISYESHIVNWIEECIIAALHYPTIRETLIQYTTHLKQLTNQDMDTKNSKEIVDILVREDNFESVLSIINNSGEFYKKIVEKYLIPALQKIAQEKQFILAKISDEFVNGNKYGYFEFHKAEWLRLGVRFAFDKNNYNDFYWSLHCKDENNKFNKSKWQDIGIFNISMATEQKPYGDEYHKFRNWNNETWMNIVNGEFSAEIENNLDRILSFVNENPDIEL